VSLGALFSEGLELLEGQDLGQNCFSLTETELLHMLKVRDVGGFFLIRCLQ